MKWPGSDEEVISMARDMNDRQGEDKVAETDLNQNWESGNEADLLSDASLSRDSQFPSPFASPITTHLSAAHQNFIKPLNFLHLK